ncbi:MAG: DUF4097 family beta strand repeat-containing protein [Anaeroplasmataceae bacterium]|nr:DUF4097 family beta strand repeat-containing protein [Anaeroplasmataceae bacterium]MDE6414113.1 DUF4097 family beta strand repeat-containing protein [Anaeroplasmataceae bacterium]
MEKFLEELRNALKEAKVENCDEIVNEYSEHFSLGHEAGMTDEEIIERFDSIEDIVAQASRTKKDSTRYEVTLDLECFSEFEFVRTSEITGIEFNIDEGAFKYVSIVREGNKIHLKSKKFKSFFKMESNFEGTMYVGLDVIFDQLNINNVNTDISCDFKIQCCDFSLSNVNGDIEGFNVVAEETIIINNTSGDIDLDNVEAPNVKIGTVSGDITIEELTADTVKLSTVSGDINIHVTSEADYNINTVSGDVKIEEGAAPSKVKVSTVSGEVEIDGEVISKSISERIKNSFKW